MFNFLQGSSQPKPRREGVPEPDTTAEFAALAYVRHFQFHAHHELSTERLEPRRRQLLRDYQELKARHEHSAASDAEIINE